MPADEGLPTFQIRPSADADPFKSLINICQDYRPAQPYYIKHRSHEAASYGIAVSDAYNTDIIFAQVVVTPTLSTPSLSADEIRRQREGGPPRLPDIGVPKEFVVQLYNPDSKVTVRQKESRWTGGYWEFSLPIKSFRQPTGSRLDAEAARSSAIPLTGVSTFRWRKDGGVVSRASLRCTLLSTANTAEGNANAKKKGGGEPDITLAIMDKFKDITMYTQHFTRVDVEDLKGLELVLITSAAVIADLYHSPAAQMFNVSPQSALSSPNGKRNSVTSSSPTILTQTPSLPGAMANNNLYETQRRQREEEDHARRIASEAEAEERRIRKMLDDESRAEAKRIAAVEAETERLRRQYANDPSAWGGYHQAQPLQEAYRQQPYRRYSAGYTQQQLPPRRVSEPERRPVPQIQYQMQQSPQGQRPQPDVSAYSQTQGLVAPQVHGLGHKRKSSNFLRVFGVGGGDGGAPSASGGGLGVPQDTGKLVRKKKSSLW